MWSNHQVWRPVLAAGGRGPPRETAGTETEPSVGIGACLRGHRENLGSPRQRHVRPAVDGAHRPRAQRSARSAILQQRAFRASQRQVDALPEQTRSSVRLVQKLAFQRVGSQLCGPQWKDKCSVRFGEKVVPTRDPVTSSQLSSPPVEDPRSLRKR